MTDQSQAKARYTYYINMEEYETDKRNVTGAYIRSHAPIGLRDYHLYLEDTDKSKPDRLFNDDNTVSLENGARYFNIHPRATFGG